MAPVPARESTAVTESLPDFSPLAVPFLSFVHELHIFSICPFIFAYIRVEGFTIALGAGVVGAAADVLSNDRPMMAQSLVHNNLICIGINSPLARVPGLKFD